MTLISSTRARRMSIHYLKGAFRPVHSHSAPSWRAGAPFPHTHVRSWHLRGGSPPCLTPGFFLLTFETQPIFDGQNGAGARPADPFEVEMLDVLPQRHLPRFLPVVVELAELLRVHPELASHLDLSMRKVVALPRLDPRLHLPVHFHFFPGHPLPFSGGRSVRAGPFPIPPPPKFSLWGPQSPFPKSRTGADSLQALIR